MTLTHPVKKQNRLAIVLVFILQSFLGGFAQSLRIIDAFNYDSGTYIESQKAFYAATSADGSSVYSNRLIKIDPRWGKVLAEYYVGLEPRYLRVTSDQSALFMLADRPQRLKRFNLNTQTVDQDYAFDIPESDVLYNIFTIPKSNNRVLLLAFRDGTEYLQVFESGKPEPFYHKLAQGEGGSMNAVFTQDSILWTLSPYPGVIKRFKVRSNGIHLEKTFTGYNNNVLSSNFQVIGDYFVSDAGLYIKYTGEVPMVEGRFPVPNEARISAPPNSAYFYSLDRTSGANLLIIKYDKNSLKPIDSIPVFAFNRTYSFTQNFHACSDDFFVLNHSGIVGTFYNCTPKQPKPKIAAPPLLYWCKADTPEQFLSTTEPAYEYYWRKGFNQFIDNSGKFKVTEEASYQVQVSEENGCLSLLSDPVELRFLTAPEKPRVYFSLPSRQFEPPFQLCKGQSALLVSSIYFFQPEWSTGSTKDTLKVDKPGIYRIRQHYQGKCYSEWSDPIEILPILPDTTPPAPQLNVINVPSGIVCSGDSITFEAPKGYTIYEWNFDVTTKNNRYTIPTVSWFDQSRMRIRVGTNAYCMSPNSETITIKTIGRPVKPSIQRSSNILFSNNTDPNALYEWRFNGNTLPGENKRMLLAKKEGLYSARTRIGECFSPNSDLLSFTGLLTNTQEPGSGQTPAFFPNPATEWLYIQTQAPNDQHLQLQLWDMQGRTQTLGVVQKNQSRLSVDIRHLSPGSYVLQGKSTGQSWVVRFVKN